MRKAVSLISGGLDSSLATTIIARQRVEILGVNFSSPFFGSKGARLVSTEIGVPLEVVDLSPSYLRLIKDPKYGFGKNMNPCIDCHILMLKKAGEYMVEKGADFIITGEVLGSRPKSQTRNALRIIEKESGLEGLIVRPLSAKLLPPSLPELQGWVDRESLLDIHGRSRKRQLALARELGVTRFSQPAGGCLLTDPSFSRRLRDLLSHISPTIHDLELLKYGRHLRISPEAKLIVGRNENDNLHLKRLSRTGDLILMVKGHKGPFAILRGRIDEEVFIKAASICARYSDAKGLERVKVGISLFEERWEREIWVSPKGAEELGVELL
jgi:tRNA U34 2-thiouridine synthase MnmA/TrmU